MAQSQKDKDAEGVVKASIFALLGRETIERIAVFPVEDQAGEPGLSVTIYLTSGQKRMSGSRLLDTIDAAVTALREREDYRFPFVTFLLPEEEGAEDTRPAA
jgi:hypothetical protein